MHRTRRHVWLPALGAALLLLLGIVGQLRVQASPSGDSFTRSDPPQADAEGTNLAGLWDFGDGLIVKIEQSGTSITSEVVKHECSGAEWERLVSGDVAGDVDNATLSGTMQRCTPDDNVIVSECGWEALWDTPFEAEVSRHEIVGTYTGQWIEWDTVDGRATNCRLDHETEDSFSGTRIDCRPLTFDELAKEHPDYAHEVSLAGEFEGGKTLHWTDEQVANGFKERAETFAREVARSQVYGPGRINSAYRPYLYQAHFANLRECGLTLIRALQDHGHDADLAAAIGEGVDAVTAEVNKHALKTEDTTVAGKTVRVPFVCWRDPISGCPHVDGKAIDVSFNQAIGLDWIGALQGWCRRYIEKDKPHWEEISQGLCGQEFLPGRADINIYVDSPVGIMVTDGSGRRIGYDPSSGETVNDIGEGAYYTGPDAEPQHLFVPAGVFAGDEVEIVLTATGDGPYKVRLSFIDEDGVEPTELVLEGVARMGEPIEPVRRAFTPTSDAVGYPEATEGSPDEGSAQSFDTPDTGGRISLSSAVAQAVLINPDLLAIGMRLTEGAAGDITVRVPAALVRQPVGVRVDQTAVSSSVDVVDGVATVRFSLPAGARIIEIGGLGPGPAEGGIPILLAVLGLVTLAVLVALLLLARRRHNRRRLPAS